MPIILARRGLRSALPGYTGGAVGELLVTTDTDELWFGKGAGVAPEPLNVMALMPSSYAASATSSTGQSLTSGTSTIINFSTIENDSYGDIAEGTNWKYTARIDGLYDINSMLTFQSYSWSAGKTCDLMLYKNGVLLRYLNRYSQAAARTFQFSIAGSTKIWLASGDYFDLRLNQNRGTSALQATTQMNWITIAREI
jgi:hypothetical protein